MRTVLLLSLLATKAAAEPPGFVRIPPGSFGRARFERPFWMGKTEVSVRQFSAFVKATGFRTTAEIAEAPRTWKAPGYKISGDQPVVYVTVKDAAAYCASIGGRLPRDDEWEYAARAIRPPGTIGAMLSTTAISGFARIRTDGRTPWERSCPTRGACSTSRETSESGPSPNP